MFESINQIGRARNAGAAAATGDWLIFVDADSQPDEGLFRDVAAAISDPACLAGGSTLRLDGWYPVASMITQGWNLLSRIKKWAPGSFLFCEARAFRELGGFNQELYASEEIELFQRFKKLARARGRRIVILHRHPMITSARKLRLYTIREHLVFFAKTVLVGGRNLKDRQACFTWYDGRR